MVIRSATAKNGVDDGDLVWPQAVSPVEVLRSNREGVVEIVVLLVLEHVLNSEESSGSGCESLASEVVQEGEGSTGVHTLEERGLELAGSGFNVAATGKVAFASTGGPEHDSKIKERLDASGAIG